MILLMKWKKGIKLISDHREYILAFRVISMAMQLFIQNISNENIPNRSIINNE